MPLPKVKICCISSLSEAQHAIEFGAAALGLVGPMPSGPGIIDNALILEIAQKIPPPIASFLLTSETSASRIVDHQQKVHTNTIQLVDAIEEGHYAEIRNALPAVKLVQVIHVLDEQSVEAALQTAAYVDALLLDSGSPNKAVKELGGTGRTHNWALSRKIVEQSSIPVFLAGGLKAENVKRAMDEVGPYGLDLCSGVRSAGQLDLHKLDAFFRAVGY